MPRLKLRYFDFPGGRGESIRLALTIGGVPFEDDRVPVDSWPAIREQTPFHALPTLEVDGEVLTQSNTLNRYVGQLTGLYPEDPLEAARCDEPMDAIEDIVARVVATFDLDDADKKTEREKLVDGLLTLYLMRLEAMLEARGGEWFADHRLTVADLRAHVWITNLRSGVVDHIPKGLAERLAPRLVALSERVRSHEAVVAYYAT